MVSNKEKNCSILNSSGRLSAQNLILRAQRHLREERFQEAEELQKSRKEEKIAGADDLKSSRPKQAGSLGRCKRDGVMIKSALRHYIAGAGVPRIILPQRKQTAGAEAVSYVIHGRSSLSNSDMVKSTGAINQLNIGGRNMLVKSRKTARADRVPQSRDF